MKILHWTESYHPRIGGMEVFAQNLAESLQSIGHECLIFSDTYGYLPGEENVNGVKVYRFDFRGVLESKNLPEIVRLARFASSLVEKEKPDLIHLHTSQHGAFFFLRIRSAKKTRSIYTTHDPLVQVDQKNSMFYQLLQRVDAAAAISEYMLHEITGIDSAIQNKVRLIVNASPAANELPKSLSFDPPVFLGLGRISADKGFDLLVESFATLQKKTNARLILAGDGTEKSKLMVQAGRLNIADKIEFTGWVPPKQTAELINRSSCVVVPSRWNEPFGLVALQALQMSRPVIAARTGGLPEIVVHEKNGYLFEKENTEMLERFMEQIALHPAKSVQMGQAGRTYAAEKFNWSRLVEEYISLYEEIIR